jgi:hypothetical protein
MQASHGVFRMYLKHRLRIYGIFFSPLHVRGAFILSVCLRKAYGMLTAS